MAWILRAEPGEIYFTSGGAPKATTGGALAGTAQARGKAGGKQLITTQVEHPSVLEVFRRLEEQGFTVTYVPVDEYG